MTKQKKITEILFHLAQAETHVRDGVLLLNDLLAEYDANEDFAKYKRSFFRIVQTDDAPPATAPTVFSSQNKNPDAGTPGILEQGFVEFTEQEILTMPKKIQRLIIIQKQRCRIRSRRCGTSYTYEIRLRRDGYNVSASGKTIELAKANMLRKLSNAKPCATSRDETSAPSTFKEFATFYFETFRKEKVSALTYRADDGRYKKHLLPHFGSTPLKKITPADCKALLDRVKQEGKGKTADELYSLMSIIFKGAIAHGIIDKNPLDVVLHIAHEGESGEALTFEEERVLMNGLTEREFAIAAALSLYCGLRPNEVQTARIEGEFIVVELRGCLVFYKEVERTEIALYFFIPIEKIRRTHSGMPYFCLKRMYLLP